MSRVALRDHWDEFGVSRSEFARRRNARMVAAMKDMRNRQAVARIKPVLELVPVRQIEVFPPMSEEAAELDLWSFEWGKNRISLPFIASVYGVRS